jgi:hypothetical protein
MPIVGRHDCSPDERAEQKADRRSDDSQEDAPLGNGVGEPAWWACDRHGCHVHPSCAGIADISS